MSKLLPDRSYNPKSQIDEANVVVPTQAEKVRDSIWVKLSLIFLGIMIVCFLLELSLRIVGSRFQPTVWKDRPQFSYLPEFSPDNRNFPYVAEKAPNTFRIIVIGDSFTFAGKVQYDDNFALRLGRMLNLNAVQPKVEVLNWGVPGISTIHETKLMKKAVRDYHADLVILEITLNDAEAKKYTPEEGSAVVLREKLAQNFFVQHLKGVALIVDRILNHRQNQEYIEYHQQLFENSKTWNPFAGALEKISEMGESSHVPVLAVIFPMFSHTINNQYPFRSAHEKILAKLATTKIQALDLRSAYEDIPADRLQAIPGVDAHPNEIAHRIAAEAIYQRLLALQLVPAEAFNKRYRLEGRSLPNELYKMKIIDSGNDPDTHPLKNPDESSED